MHNLVVSGSFRERSKGAINKMGEYNNVGEPTPEDMTLEEMSCQDFSSTGNRTLVSRGLSVLMTSGNHSH
jgi:ribosomal protein S16